MYRRIHPLCLKHRVCSLFKTIQQTTGIPFTLSTPLYRRPYFHYPFAVKNYVWVSCVKQRLCSDKNIKISRPRSRSFISTKYRGRPTPNHRRCSILKIECISPRNLTLISISITVRERTPAWGLFVDRHSTIRCYSIPVPGSVVVPLQYA